MRTSYWPLTRDDVRGTTQKSAFPRSALRLGSSEATPAVLDGSQNGLQAADGPLPWPRTRDDARGATQKSVVPRSARRLASSDVVCVFSYLVDPAASVSAVLMMLGGCAYSVLYLKLYRSFSRPIYQSGYDAKFRQSVGLPYRKSQPAGGGVS